MLSVNAVRKHRFSHRRSKFDPLILEAFQRLPLRSLEHPEWYTPAEIVFTIRKYAPGDFPQGWIFTHRITQRLLALVDMGFLNQWVDGKTGTVTFKYEPNLGKKVYAKRRMPSESHEWL